MVFTLPQRDLAAVSDGVVRALAGQGARIGRDAWLGAKRAVAKFMIEDTSVMPFR